MTGELAGHHEHVRHREHRAAEEQRHADVRKGGLPLLTHRRPVAPSLRREEQAQRAGRDGDDADRRQSTLDDTRRHLPAQGLQKVGTTRSPRGHPRGDERGERRDDDEADDPAESDVGGRIEGRHLPAGDLRGDDTERGAEDGTDERGQRTEDHRVGQDDAAQDGAGAAVRRDEPEAATLTRRAGRERRAGEQCRHGDEGHRRDGDGEGHARIARRIHVIGARLRGHVVAGRQVEAESVPLLDVSGRERARVVEEEPR